MLMKNRTVLGILCLILALLLAFGLTPIMNKLSDGRVSVVRMKQDLLAVVAAPPVCRSRLPA